MNTNAMEKSLAVFREKVRSVSNLPPDEREAAERAALAHFHLSIDPDLIKDGPLSFLREDMEQMLDDERRTLDSLGRKKSKNQVMSARRISLLVAAGFAAAALRTEAPLRRKLNKDKANVKVSRWTGGHVSPAQIAKWTPRFGAVRTDGRDIAKEDPVRDGMSKFFDPQMSEKDLIHRVRKARRDYEFTLPEN